jgi:hypothetical protein
LPGEELAEGVADVDRADLGARDAGRGERALDDLPDEAVEPDALAGEVAGEIALVTSEDPDSSGHDLPLRGDAAAYFI